MKNSDRSLRQSISGLNAGYVLELYDRYQAKPRSVDDATRIFFEHWTPPLETDALEIANIDQLIGAANLAQAIRSYGHLNAQLDPLGMPPPGDPALDPKFHGVREDDLRRLPASLIGGPVAAQAANAFEAIEALRRIYSFTIGYDYDHIHIPEERTWLREAAESGRFRPPRDPIDPRRLLERLTQVEVFEHFLHRIFPGRTRFSIEGVDMLVPLLDEIIDTAAEANICAIVIGMAHRGRLNVLAHVLGMTYEQILAEFKAPKGQFTAWDTLGWTGDVKYHKGARFAVDDGAEIRLVISLPANPSHLEYINPVIEGMARAANSKVDRAGAPTLYSNAALPILIHGDAAFTGEGVVAETLNLSRLPGYTTSGTLHIIANNQLGYTATEVESRSSLYASDLAKGYQLPVIHVNADDVEACLEAIRTALAYRLQFKKDFMIDLVGYRRYGHNEGDEPSFTQPLMYARIQQHPSVRALWANTLIERELIMQAEAERLVQDGLQQFQAVHEKLKAEEALIEEHPEPPPPQAAQRVKTAVEMQRLRELNEALLTLPDKFNLHRKLTRAMQQRREAFAAMDAHSIEWATAEELALATIVQDGIAIRFTGEDVVRGTFSQRHAVFFDAQTNEPFTPLQAIPQAVAAFEIHNSPLTENSTIGFEFGYNVQAPDRLVIWEAQYGDFINVAQPMIDEFIVSARAKWGQTPSLVLLLPHGNEGQGPDHSSARIERFLNLAAETNLRIAFPTTAAQYFHVLRRQALLLKTDPLPLMLFTPKGLLRHPLTASCPRDLSEGSWRAVLDDADRTGTADRVRRVILCSGRVFVDLMSSDRRAASDDVAIVRVEQLYPFPQEAIRNVLDRYVNLEQVLWVQEEPRNMGAWEFVRGPLTDVIRGRWPLTYIGRPASSSPAEGSATWYAATQQALIARAYDLQGEAATTGVILERQ